VDPKKSFFRQIFLRLLHPPSHNDIPCFYDIADGALCVGLAFSSSCRSFYGAHLSSRSILLTRLFFDQKLLQSYATHYGHISDIAGPPRLTGPGRSVGKPVGVLRFPF